MILRCSTLALCAICLSAAPFATALSLAEIPADTPVSQLTSLANTALASGNAQDALTYFDIAIQRDPKNYLTLFKRGATYLSLGRNTQATRDFDAVLHIKPGFEGALTQRAKIKSRDADWAAARKDYEAAGKLGAEEYEQLAEAEGAARLAEDAEKAHDWERCVTNAGTAILVAGTALDLRQRRARCRFEKGEVMEGISDLNHVLQINSGLTEPYMQISAMTFFSLGETDKGIQAITKCLHSDPDSKACAKLRKEEKRVETSVKKVRDLLEKRQWNSAAKLLVPTGEDPGLLAEITADTKQYRESGYIHPKAGDGLYASLLECTCSAYTEMKQAAKAGPYCTEALTHNPNALPALLHKAQTQLDADAFEPALATLAQAKDAHGPTQAINDMQQTASTLLRRSKIKDYYGVLGVARDADERQIKKAFRRLTVLHHPDKAHQRGVGAEEAQRKMAAINEAYEVLADPELKARFDRGEDPMDPRQGQQPFQGSPFGYGQQGQPVYFQQRGGGGGGFKFQGGGGFPGGFPFG